MLDVIEVELKPRESKFVTFPVGSLLADLIARYKKLNEEIGAISTIHAPMDKLRQKYEKRKLRDEVHEQIVNYLSSRVDEDHYVIRWKMTAVPPPDPPGGSD